MSLVDRTYPVVARDMLTTLTGGIAGEEHVVAYTTAEVPMPEPIVLLRRPVQRVSSVSEIGDADGKRVPFVFGLNDYELVGDAIQFLPFGRHPAKGSTVVVNYYPRNADATAITDVHVGSVARTLIESVAKEIAALYAQVNLAYDAAFVDTATGASLDRVVALLGLRRIRAGRAAGTAVFTRRAGTPGDITIPAGTPITDAEDKVRYETTETYAMRSGESTAEVRIRGAAESTPAVEANQLTVIARLVAGLSEVTNERPTTRATGDESDDDLRLRAGDALTSVDKGTIEALRHGLLQLGDVRDVRVEEMPNGVPGEVRLVLSLDENPDEARIQDRIEELRPAGIRVITSSASFALQARVQLLLPGSSMPSAAVTALQEALKPALVKAVESRGIGETVRVKPLLAALLGDERIVDVTLELAPRDGRVPFSAADIVVPPGSAASLSLGDIAFTSPAFEQAPEGITRLDVTAIMRVGLVLAATLDEAKSVIRAKLESYLGDLEPDTRVDCNTLLDALRDDSKYAIDPLTLLVTFSSGGTSALVSFGGGTFRVKANQQFEVGSVEVRP
jgi:hypothetical protein